MVGRDGTKLELPLGGLIRMRLDGTELETFATGFRTVLNPAMNAEGEIFLYDNNDHLNFQKSPWDRSTMADTTDTPGILGRRARATCCRWTSGFMTAGRPPGIVAYEEDGLPAPYRGQPVSLRLGATGAGPADDRAPGCRIRASSAEEKILSGAFRPTGIAISPDGMSFYIGDWQFPGWREDVVAGRLLKLSYRGKSRAAAKPAWYLPAAMGRHFRCRRPMSSSRASATRRGPCEWWPSGDWLTRGEEAIEPLRDLVQQPGRGSAGPLARHLGARCTRRRASRPGCHPRRRGRSGRFGPHPGHPRAGNTAHRRGASRGCWRIAETRMRPSASRLSRPSAAWARRRRCRRCAIGWTMMTRWSGTPLSRR